jgi:hypothetical protein
MTSTEPLNDCTDQRNSQRRELFVSLETDRTICRTQTNYGRSQRSRSAFWPELWHRLVHSLCRNGWVLVGSETGSAASALQWLNQMRLAHENSAPDKSGQIVAWKKKLWLLRIPDQRFWTLTRVHICSISSSWTSLYYAGKAKKKSTTGHNFSIEQHI